MKLFLKQLKRSLKEIVKLIDMQQCALDGIIQDDDQTEFPVDDMKMPTRNEKVLRIASLEIGVKEVTGTGNNERVVEYSRYASKNNKVEQPDSVPWCSSFVCWLVEKSGMSSTNSMMARSWLKWGLSTRKNPLPGDVVIYWRGNKSGWKGHVGIYLRTNANGSIVTLGGNQSDEVNLTSYSFSKLLDIRRSSKARPYDSDDVAILEMLAHQIINGRGLAGIGEDGKVV